MIEKIELYINRKKRRMDPKLVSIFSFLIFGILVVIAMDLLVKFKKQKDLVEDEYNRSIYEMVGYVKNVNTQLNKLKICSGSKIITTTLADIWRESNLAKENLANLPVSQQNMEKASKYLTQLSDYSYFLIEKVSSGKTISEEEYKVVDIFSEYSQSLFNITSKIYDDLNTGKIKWDDVSKIASEELSESTDINLYTISKTFQDYAGLIYDGAFSEHILDIKPKMLSGKIISKEEAEIKLKTIYGENEIEEITYVEEITNNLELYQFQIKVKSESVKKNIYITKDTGLVYLIISDKQVLENNITEKKAEEIGKKYLEKLGIFNMESTYYYVQDNMVTINYAAMQGDVILYPDLIKVKIALDDGEVCSLEAGGYIYNHSERKLTEEVKTVDEAKSKLNQKISVSSVKKAVIPTDAKEEIFVYEFKCTYNEKDYLIYLNMENLVEEEILIMIETTNGILTM